MGHYHCDMTQCEDEYINEMHGIQRERDYNNKSKDLKNDAWTSLNVIQLRLSDGRFAGAENSCTCRGGWVYIFKLIYGGGGC
jgi:hypothetical protein